MGKKWFNDACDYDSEINKKFYGKLDAKKIAPQKYCYHNWMQFAAENVNNSAQVLGAISNARTTNLPSNPDGTMDENKAGEEITNLAKQLFKTLEAIVKGLPEDERKQRLCRICLQQWDSGNHDVAADAIGELVVLASAKGLSGENKYGISEDLDRPYAFWMTRQGRCES